MVDIDPSGDIVVKATEITRNDRGEQVASNSETFRVRRQIMRQASASWSVMFDPHGPYREGAKDVFELDEVPIVSFEILLRELHPNTQASHAENISILNVWQLLGLTKKWLLKTAFLNPWFAKWYSSQRYEKIDLDTPEEEYEPTALDVLEQRQLLFPCHRFDHAEGFARATRFLAYHVRGHIEEDNPIEHDDLHLPVFTTRLLNSARFRLGLILSRDLHKVNKTLLKATCKCKGNTLWGYEKELERIGIWPFEDTVSRNSIDGLLQRLEKFNYKVADKSACTQNCQRNYNSIAGDARQRTERYFDGMCLDCMSRTKPKLKDHHSDYWNYNNFREEDGWFRGCRISHKQPSWYYSFMGREEDKNYLLEKDKLRYEYDDLGGF
ncbi:MAG: hypothetical protein Q9195_002808 [Heterodermia aff. obscurata]